jgi:hypothetical protein
MARKNTKAKQRRGRKSNRRTRRNGRKMVVGGKTPPPRKLTKEDFDNLSFTAVRIFKPSYFGSSYIGSSYEIYTFSYNKIGGVYAAEALRGKEYITISLASIKPEQRTAKFFTNDNHALLTKKYIDQTRTILKEIASVCKGTEKFIEGVDGTLNYYLSPDNEGRKSNYDETTIRNNTFFDLKGLGGFTIFDGKSIENIKKLLTDENSDKIFKIIQTEPFDVKRLVTLMKAEGDLAINLVDREPGMMEKMMKDPEIITQLMNIIPDRDLMKQIIRNSPKMIEKLKVIHPKGIEKFIEESEKKKESSFGYF